MTAQNSELITIPASVAETEAQAQTMPRGQVMREIVGPALARLLRPIYDPAITPEEADRIHPAVTFRGGNAFADSVVSVLRGRYEDVERAVPAEVSPEYRLLNALSVSGESSHRPLFTFPKPRAIIYEGIASGVIVPLTLATQIHRVEEGTADIHGRDIADSRLEPQSLANIMGRLSFNKMLMRLTKGPNGFLGNHSTHPLIFSRFFFSFFTGQDKLLTIEEAFTLKDGQVVDLSPAYHVAADGRRKELTTARSSSASTDSRERKKALTYYGNSSGCPVRHEFQNPETESPRPLILTAKDFLAAALDLSSRQREQHE